MRFWRLLVLSLAMIGVLISTVNAHAQTATPAQLSLQSSATDVKTGQEYSVDVHVDNINELWLLHYKRMTFKRRVISSALIRSPLPAPGHFSQVFFHRSGVRTVLSQKGQVRHCRGRTG